MKSNLYIVWNDINETGVPIVDEQHRGLISSINTLYYFIQNSRGDEAIKSTVVMLRLYTDIHFKTEEALMAEAGYPGLEEHVALHRDLAEKTRKLSQNVDRITEPEILLKFLKEWWLNHINQEDKKSAPFVSRLTEAG